MSGWVKIHRKMLESLVFDNPDLLRVWVWCLLKATHKEHLQMVGMQEVTLQKGQFVFGRKKAAIELNLSESKIYRLIKLLEKMGNISIKPNNKYSIITIENWELYQGCDSEDEQQTNNKRTTNEQQMNTNKNVKNDKNKYSQDELDILSFWNEQGITKHGQDKKGLQKEISKALKAYGKDTLLKAIERYVGIYKDQKYFYKHLWTLDKFLKQGNGISNYLDDGQIYLNYIKWWKEQKAHGSDDSNNEMDSETRKRIEKALDEAEKGA